MNYQKAKAVNTLDYIFMMLAWFILETCAYLYLCSHLLHKNDLSSSKIWEGKWFSVQSAVEECDDGEHNSDAAFSTDSRFLRLVDGGDQPHNWCSHGIECSIALLLVCVAINSICQPDRILYQRIWSCDSHIFKGGMKGAHDTYVETAKARRHIRQAHTPSGQVI